MTIINEPEVWIAEDDADDVLLYTEALEALGVPCSCVRCFSDGQELMENLLSENHRIPQLLLLDGRMPKMNGIDVVKALYEFRMMPQMRVAILSDCLTSREKSIVHHCGATVRSKPAYSRDLMDLLRDLLQDTSVVK